MKCCVPTVQLRHSGHPALTYASAYWLQRSRHCTCHRLSEPHHLRVKLANLIPLFSPLSPILSGK